MKLESNATQKVYRFGLIWSLIGLSCALLFLFTAPAQASLVFSNYSDITTAPDDDYSAWNSTSTPNPIVEPFTTNSGGPWSLSGIRLNAYGGGFLGGGSSPANIGIFQDNGGSVGTLVSDWGVVINTAMDEDFSFLVSGVTLGANTAYWFGVTATGSNAVGWRQTESYGTPDVSGHVFEIQGDPVPVPGAVWLLGSGIIGLAGFKRKFSKS